MLRREGPVLFAVAASGLAALALFGVGDIGHRYWAMARDYWNPRFDFYIRETLLFPAYLRALGAVGIRPSPAGNLAVVWLTAWGLALALRPRLGTARATLVGCSLPLSSMGLILFAWAGMPDFLTVLFTSVACFALGPTWLAIAGFLGATNHLSQFGFIALSIALLRGTLEEG